MEAHARPPGPLIRFGNGFELNTASGELFKRGHRLRLQEQPFQVLVALLEKPEEVVTRDELQHRLWPGHTVASFDEGLNSAIRRLRSVLGDSAEQPRYVETLPRRGYRFIAPIDTPSEPLVEVSPHVDAVVRRPGSSAPRRWQIAAAIAVAALGVIWFLVSRDSRTAPSPGATFTQITRDAGTEASPTISADGHFVAFVARADDNDDIFLQAVGSQARTNLTKASPVDDRHPAFGPRGDIIAFRSERQGGGIFAMDMAGQSVRRLSDFGYDPAWSPDGKEIVVATEGILTPLSRTSSSSLWRISLITGRKTRIAEGDAVQPAWSPKGHRIAFWGVTSGGNRAIATIAADGGDRTIIVDDSAVNWSPAWSPDGGHLYFSSDRGGAMNLWRIPIDEQSGRALGAPEAVTTPSVWSGEPSIAADGRRMVFTAAQPRSNVEKIAFDAKTGTTLSEPIPITSNTVPVVQPHVSPDGHWVVFRTESDPEDLYVSRTDGTGLRQLTFDKAKDRGPMWSPDGRMIAFYSDRAGKYDIWVIRPDGSGLKQLTAVRDWVSFPRWSPDGKRLVVNDSRGSYLIDVSTSLPVRRLSPLPPYPEKEQVFRAVAWSADGEWLAGIRYRLDGSRVPGIVAHSLQSGEYITVADIGNWAAWLSDSTRLVVAEAHRLYITDRVSAKPREIAKVDGRIPPGFAISHDDSTIFFSHAETESDIWLASNP